VLLGCGLRRSEVVALTVARVQQRDDRWCIVDIVPCVCDIGVPEDRVKLAQEIERS
jgi:hypothetical protein